MTSARRTTGAIAAGICSAALLATPAAAAPAGETFPLVCDNGQTYQVVTARGRAFFTPAFPTTGGTLVPVSFGEFVFTVEGVDNEEVDFPVVITDPQVDKGAVLRKSPRPLVTCTYGFSFTVDNEPELALDFPGATAASGQGTVTGFLAPSRP